jgi:hypothetical protein
MSITVTTRVRGLALWKPRRATHELLDVVRRVLDEYAAYLPLTLRQIFYRLVGAHGFEKTENAYARLGECLNRARRAGLIDFSAIRDDGAQIVTSMGYTSLADLVDTWQRDAQTFRLDRQEGQPQQLLFMVEARGMVPQIEAVTHPFGIPVIGSGGFDSLTAKYDLANQLGDCDDGTEVLHIGDYDPSGVHLFSSVADDVETLIDDLGLPGSVEFTRLAVTPKQIAELRLPTAPPKQTDRRSFDGDGTVQAEAIPPDVLAEIVRNAITERLNVAAYERVLKHERQIREHLIARLEPLLDDGDAL